MTEIIGARNIFGDEKGILFPSNEEIIARNPDVIFTNINNDPKIIESIKNRPGYKLITAVKTGAVYLVDWNATSRPSPIIIKGLRLMAKDVYPEQYAELTFIAGE
jgi:iron complex transport system substrate-binding protein